MLSRHISVILAGCLVASAASAAPSAVGQYKDWKVFTDKVGGETMCYAATPATDKAPKSAEHGDVWFYVASSMSGKARSQPSLRVGYQLRRDLPGKAKVGRASYTMFGMGSEAFTQDSDDPRLVRSLKSGSELRVEATSERNTRVTYHFSLAGSSAAINRAAAACH